MGRWACEGPGAAVFWCAKRSLVVLVNCKVFIVIIGRQSYSPLCGGREQSSPSRPEAAKARDVVSCELVSASLQRNTESGQPPKKGEASIVPEATTMCRGWTLRGVRRQHAPTEPLGTWEARFSGPAAAAGQRSRRSHKPELCGIAASERPIVARKFRSSRDGAKGPWSESGGVRGNRS